MSDTDSYLEDAEHESLTGRWAPWNVDIHRHNPIATPCNAVAVVVVAAPIRTRTHADNPSRVRHLVVDLAQCWGHLVGESAGNDHHIGLSRRGTKDDTESILIIAGCGEMHHLDGAAGKAERHGPEGPLASPICNLIHGGSFRVSQHVGGGDGIGDQIQGILHSAFLLLLTRQWDFSSGLAGRRERRA